MRALPASGGGTNIPPPGSEARAPQLERQPGRKPGRNEGKKALMDAKYNWLMDSMAARITFNTVVLVLWLAAAVGLLELAVKL